MCAGGSCASVLDLVMSLFYVFIDTLLLLSLVAGTVGDIRPDLIPVLHLTGIILILHSTMITGALHIPDLPSPGAPLDGLSEAGIVPLLPHVTGDSTGHPHHPRNLHHVGTYQGGLALAQTGRIGGGGRGRAPVLQERHGGQGEGTGHLLALMQRTEDEDGGEIAPVSAPPPEMGEWEGREG